jgi:hypothetical protein
VVHLSHTQQQPASPHGYGGDSLLFAGSTPKPAPTKSALAYLSINSDDFRRTAHSFSLALEGRMDWWEEWLEFLALPSF